MSERRKQLLEPGLAIRIQGLKKEYRLGEIGGTTLQAELKRWWALKRGQEDPCSVLGEGERKRGDRFMALNGIDLEVRQGEALGIIGKNGAGKSTLLKILCQITAPTEGTVTIRGRIASMLEVGTGFHGEMTGRENVYLNGAILGMSKAEIDAKMQDIIDFSEVRDFIDTPVKRYSSGMFVKLAFSVAAHLDNEILIMDEVLAVGDMEFQSKCLKRMREAAQVEGRTVLYVSHNMNTIRHLCSRCIVLDEGRVVFDGDVDQAIAIYIGLQDRLKTSFRFGEEFRPYGRFGRRFSLDGLEALGVTEPKYPENGRAVFRIDCSAAEPLDSVRFRLELWYQDGSKIGSMLSEPVAHLDPGAHTVRLEADLTGLTKGQYSADLVAYTADENGTEELLDGVYPGIVFNVEEAAEADHHVEWSHQYWGHIRLRDMRVIPEARGSV